MSRKIGIAVCCIALTGAGAWAISAVFGDDDSPAKVAQAEANPLPLPPEEAAAAAVPQTDAEVLAAERKAAELRRRVKQDPTTIPPASAGSNGSYEPRPASERRRIGAKTHLPDGTDEGDAALLLGDTAIAPPGAPPQIQNVVSAANSIVGQPYLWGGGHASFRSRGYDCSGAVSYALAGAGLINRPATSGELAGWGEPGRGRWLTVYAKGSHVYAVVGGLRWDTVGNQNGTGPRWQPLDAYPAGYEMRHLPGL